MEQIELIDKSTVVAEIEKKIANIKEYCLHEGHDVKFDVVPEQLSHILSFINTLKVKKKVDLEKEFDSYCKDIRSIDIEEDPFTQMYECAKHFFELGLKAKERIKK